MAGREGVPEATRDLLKHIEGCQEATKRLSERLYGELRQLAARRLGGRGDQILQPTVLAHEAFLRLIDQTRIDWAGRTHFLSVAALMMRRLISNHLRANKNKPQSGQVTVTLIADEASTEFDVNPADLEQALAKLSSVRERHARIIELRFFGGLKVKEIGDHLGVSETTVKQDWRAARAWLHKELEGDCHDRQEST